MITNRASVLETGLRPSAKSFFFERNPALTLSRRAAAEGIGTLLLMFASAGSNMFAQQQQAGHLAERFMSAIATSGALVALILAFQSVSGGHFNPLISGLQWAWGQRKLDCALAYIAAQIVGAISGALLANVIFATGKPANPAITSGRFVASELISSAGLMVIVLGLSKRGKTDLGPFAVGGWLAAAIVSTPSGSYANPAITLGSMFAGGPVNLSVQTTFSYLPAQIGGTILAAFVISFCFPRSGADLSSRDKPWRQRILRNDDRRSARKERRS